MLSQVSTCFRRSSREGNLQEDEDEDEESCVSEEDADVEMSSVPQSGEEINKELGILCKDASGITPFSNTAVEFKTKTPFLLRGKLREYQHVGLDWLVAMEKKRLNGILADEMGLGMLLLRYQSFIL